MGNAPFDFFDTLPASHGCARTGATLTRLAENFRTSLLLGALIGATLLVAAVTVRLSYVYFPPHFTGWGEITADGKISGWVVDRSRPHAPVEVQLYVDGRFVAHGMADLPRPDVLKAGWTADERCGYSFDLPPLPEGEHEARVHVLHDAGGGHLSLLATGDALRFYVDGDGRVRR